MKPLKHINKVLIEGYGSLHSIFGERDPTVRHIYYIILDFNKLMKTHELVPKRRYEALVECHRHHSAKDRSKYNGK